MPEIEPDTIEIELGPRLQFVIGGAMRAKGWNVRDLAREADLVYNTFREHLKAGELSLTDLEKVAKAFGMKIHELLHAAETAEGRAIRAEWKLEVLENPHAVQLRLETAGYRPFRERAQLVLA